MARSLLPSRGRKAARKARAHIHRGSRRGSREALSQLGREPRIWEDMPPVGDASSPEIRFLVQDRRWADKVHPFIRWATAVTRELPQELRLSHVRGLLPKGIIGEHALSHLKHTRAFMDPAEREWILARRRRRPPEWLDRGEQAQLLRQVLQAPEGHRTFNRWLRHQSLVKGSCRGTQAEPLRARMLQGSHDVLPFLDTVGHMARGRKGQQWWGPARTHSECFQSMDRFLRAFKQCRGEVTATLAALGVKDGRWGEPTLVRSLAKINWPRPAL